MKIGSLSLLVAVSLVAGAAVLGAACGTAAEKCLPSNCPTGCCDADGVCQPGVLPSACGQSGSACGVCGAGQFCQIGACIGGGPEPEPDAGTDAGTDGGTDAGLDAGACNPVTATCECIEDEQCPGDGLFFCNTSTFTCQPACRTKQDCTAAVRGEYALPYCEHDLGCVCDEGNCLVALCSANVDCGANGACRNGTCVAPPAAASATACQITPDYALVKEGEKVQFWVSFWSGTEPVVLETGIAWAATSNRVSGPSASGNTAAFTGLIAGEATQAVKVTAGSAECFATVRTLTAAVTATDVRVTVVDEFTGRQVEGATVLFSHPTTGAALGSPAVTAANGSVSIDYGGQSSLTATAFHNDYAYVSVIDVPTSGSRDLLIATRRNPSDRYGGYTGTFTNVPPTSNMHLGLAGSSIPGAASDVSVSRLLGHPVLTHVKIGSAIDQNDVPIPAGVYLGFSGSEIKEQVSARGAAGVCTDAQGNPSEAAIRAGNCGTRTAWGLAGDVPLGDLPIDLLTGGADVDMAKLILRMAPAFRRFSSSVHRDVAFTLMPVATPEAPDLTDTAHFTSGVNHAFDQMPLAFDFAVIVPDLPQFHSVFAQSVLLLGGADVKGRGLVPLGLGAGANTAEPLDAKVDVQTTLPAGQVRVRMAPTHRGLEGSQYGLTVVALSEQHLSDASVGRALSAIHHRVPENRLVFDPKGEIPMALGGSFLNYPEGARYNFTSAAQAGLGPRTFRFVGGKDLSPASVIRVQFTNVAGRSWSALAAPATASAGFVLPAAPAAFSDRTFHTGNTAGERSAMGVQVLQLRSGASTVSHAQWVALNSTNPDRLTDFLTAYSAVDHGRPDITWVAPVGGATVPPVSTLRLDVSHFKVGTSAGADGVVKLTFGGGASAGCTEQTINQDASGGAGELSHTLPSTCTGTGVLMTATLHNTQGPVAPGVSRAITVNIQ